MELQRFVVVRDFCLERTREFSIYQENLCQEYGHLLRNSLCAIVFLERFLVFVQANRRPKQLSLMHFDLVEYDLSVRFVQISVN